ncbi:MAG: hypothetical protein EA369_03180 [Bradymonadales bacterium]|nr:MAG: hypothetical protein EA369_03180 [Bradymonadales bacterium]
MTKKTAALSWRVFLPTSVLVAGLLWIYASRLIADIEETQRRYVAAGSVFLEYVNELNGAAFRVCRQAKAQEIAEIEGLREGDVVLVAKKTGEVFPMSVFVRNLHRSKIRTEFESLLRQRDLSIYSLPTRSCSKWDEILMLYDQRMAGPLSFEES